jgi:hypothetical protein
MEKGTCIACDEYTELTSITSGPWAKKIWGFCKEHDENEL